MSAKQANKKLPITLAVISIMLVGVIALNINTFGGSTLGRKSTRGYRVQAHPPVPSDMGQRVFFAVDLKGGQNGKKTGTVITTKGRDPFFPSKAQPVPVVRPSSRKGKSKRSKVVAKPLECTAIMLGGKRPMAIINGEGRYPGDTIHGLVMVSLDADGVTFRKSDGSLKRIKVGVQESANEDYRVVTRVRETDHQGRTSLVDQ